MTTATTQVLEREAGPRHEGRVSSALRALHKFWKRRTIGAISGIVLLILILVAIFAPLIAPYGELEIANPAGLEGPVSPARVLLGDFGTDRQGRDIYSRVLYGARISMEVGFLAVAISTAIAGVIGLVTGYFGGIVDLLVMRLMDILMAFPSLILALAILAVFGPSLNNVILVIAITNIPYIARVARSAVISVKENQYVEAARALGARDMRVMFRHVLPNIVPVLIVYSGTYIGFSIVAEASLSFLGVGIPPTQASWGGMLSQDGARAYMRTAPYIVIFPAVALTLTVLSANLFADALRDHLDPRLRGSR